MKNDRVLSDSVFLITQHARKMDQLLRDGKLRELGLVVGEVQDAALKAGYRCNDLRYGVPEKP